ncbi:MAG: hypothetical protein ACMG57_05545 [Candidatus Dojkabacteria bacterium]
MDYSSKFFQNLQFKMDWLLGEDDPPYGPEFEDEDDRDRYFQDFTCYDDWLEKYNCRDSLQIRIEYFTFILSWMQDKNSPEYFGYFLRDKHFEILREVTKYIADEIGLQSIDPYGVFNDFLISAHAEDDESLRQLRYDSYNNMLANYFNNREDLNDFFISGIYSMFDYVHHIAEM